MTESKKPKGRPSIYTPELAKEICDTIGSTTKGLPTLCQMNDHWPCYNAIYEWIQDNRCSFGDMYAKAKENQADYLVDDILRIIDKPETFIENGVERNDTQMIRIKVDAMKWQAMKLKPKKYDKHVEDLQADNERVKQELQEVKERLDMANRKDY